MNIRMKRLFGIPILLCVALAVLAPGCAQPVPPPRAPRSVTEPSEIDPAAAIEVQLSMPDFPELDKPLQLTATFSIVERYNGDAPNTMVEIVLPKGYELVEGDLKRTVDVMRGAPAEMQVTVKAVEKGMWLIVGKATCSPGAEPCVGGYGQIYPNL